METAESKVVPVDEGAEAFIELLNANDVDYIFLSSGSGSASIQEALSKFKALGQRTPEVILSLHEFVAMSAAHGYFMVSGKPQVVLVHRTLGTSQLGGALLNAQRGRAGVVLGATRVPSSKDITGPSGRGGALEWIHEQFDQAGSVREYVKWEYELRSTETISQVVQRAFRVASSEPCGPVYISLPQEFLSQKIKEVNIPPIAKHTAAVTPEADPSALDRAAELLIAAEEPLIMTGHLGRNPKGVGLLVELAETLGARVVSSPWHNNMNFPTTHPLCGGFDSGRYLEEADVIFMVDVDIPYAPGRANLRSDVRIIHFDIDPLKKDFPMWGFPVDVLVDCDSSKALPLLNQIIRQSATPEDKARFQDRFHRFEGEHQQMWKQWLDLAMTKATQKPISVDWLSHCISEVIDDETIVVEDAVTNRSRVMRQLQRTKPGTCFHNGGQSLGWALGAALGAKLASPNSTVVSLVGDGTFIFGNPIPALWAANVYHAPFLCIIFNNKSYNVARGAIRRTYGEQSFSEKTGVWIGVDITPPPDYALIAQACGAYGQTVDEPEDVQSALKDALEQVRQGKPAVVDVRID